MLFFHIKTPAGSGCCVVDRQRRNWCPACRLAKCFRARHNSFREDSQLGFLLLNFFGVSSFPNCLHRPQDEPGCGAGGARAAASCPARPRYYSGGGEGPGGVAPAGPGPAPSPGRPLAGRARPVRQAAGPPPARAPSPRSPRGLARGVRFAGWASADPGIQTRLAGQ